MQAKGHHGGEQRQRSSSGDRGEVDVPAEGAAATQFTHEQFQEIMAPTVQMVWEDGPEDEHK